MLSRLRVNAEVLRATRKIASVEKKRLIGGLESCWETELSFSGLTEDRREALIAAMTEKISPAILAERLPKDDDLLHGYSVTHSCSMAVAGITGLIESSARMDAAGITAEEMLAAQVTLSISPITLTGNPVRFNRFQRYGHGLSVAAAVLADESIKHRLGASTYDVQGFLSGLDEESAEAISCVTSFQDGFVSEGILDFNITADNVGSGLGALLLSLRNLHNLIDLAPLTASLKLVAVREEERAS